MSFLKRLILRNSDLFIRRGPASAVRERRAPCPMGETRQWFRLEQVLARAVAGQGDVSRLHQEAALQLDAAGYALSRLMIELSGVMTLAIPPQPNAEIVPIRIPVRAATPLRPRKAMAA